MGNLLANIFVSEDIAYSENCKKILRNVAIWSLVG